MRLLFAFVALVALACGQPQNTYQPTPVKSTPLTGTIDGKAWTPVSGTARHMSFGDADSKWIDLGTKTFDCASFVPDSDFIGTVKPWADGTAYDLSLAQNLTFINHTADGGTSNEVATTGRVEIISAGAPDAGKATVRIRASFGSNNSIEGQIDLTVCN